MTDDEIIQMTREHFERLFPKVCPTCDRCFATLQEYILDTKRIGMTICSDNENNRLSGKPDACVESVERNRYEYPKKKTLVVYP